MTPNNPLRAELVQARERVSGKTFAEAPELFKDIEGIKVRIWTQSRFKGASKVDVK